MRTLNRDVLKSVQGRLLVVLISAAAAMPVMANIVEAAPLRSYAHTSFRAGDYDTSFGSAGRQVLPLLQPDYSSIRWGVQRPIAAAAVPSVNGGTISIAGGADQSMQADFVARSWSGSTNRGFCATTTWQGRRCVPGQSPGPSIVGQSPSRAVATSLPGGGVAGFFVDNMSAYRLATVHGRVVTKDGQRPTSWSKYTDGAVHWEAPWQINATAALGGAVSLPDGRLRVCLTWRQQGSNSGAAFLTGWTANGVNSLSDQSSGRNSEVRINQLAGCRSIAVDGASRLYLAGPLLADGAAVVRLDERGAVDAAWGTKGVVALPAGTTPVFTQMKATRSGVLFVGVRTKSSGGSASAGVIKLLASGAVDTTFGFRGVRLLPSVDGTSNLDAITLGPNGTVLAAYTTASRSGARVHRIARFSSQTGALDRTFGTSGQISVNLLPVDMWTSGFGGKKTLTIVGNSADWLRGSWHPYRAVIERRLL